MFLSLSYNSVAFNEVDGYDHFSIGINDTEFFDHCLIKLNLYHPLGLNDLYVAGVLAIIEIYDKRELNVPYNIVRYIAKLDHIDKLVNICNKYIKGFDKYLIDVNKYLMLI